MVFLVPFDGSDAATSALERAVEHGRALDREVVAVAFVPTGSAFAQRRIWVDTDDDFAVESAHAELKRKIAEATDASELPFEEATAGSPTDGIADEVRGVAADVDATVLFVGVGGSANGEEPITRFGDIAADADYDIHLVRTG